MAELTDPPLTEGAHFLMLMAAHPDYQQACIVFWTERYGRQFAESVRREVLKRTAKKKGKKNDANRAA